MHSFAFLIAILLCAVAITFLETQDD